MFIRAGGPCIDFLGEIFNLLNALGSVSGERTKNFYGL